jgi:hypothetical protein
MNFETVYSELPSRSQEPLAHTQVKMKAAVELKTACKQILSASAVCYVNGTERAESEVRVSGKVTTRVIYIDETGAFNSEEHTDTFTEKLTIEGFANVTSVTATAMVIETDTPDTTGEKVDLTNIIDITVIGVVEKSMRYVSDVRGNGDCKREKMPVTILGNLIEERFVVDDRFDLDKSCEGILGVDVGAYIRDITMGEGKIVLKGSLCASVIGVKSGETMSVFNSTHEFDFNKTVPVKTAGTDDLARGTVTVTNVVVRAENKTKPELVIEADLLFCGNITSVAPLEFVTDAICFDSGLQFTRASGDSAVVLPQVNVAVDIEGNTGMPNGSPYIAKVLATAAPLINSINIIPADGKVTIEGVLCAQIIYECEEKLIHSHSVQVPFATSVKADGVDKKHDVGVFVKPISCNIKARRGKELLVDARLGISLNASSKTAATLIGEIVKDVPKTEDESAIVIYLVSQRETLWDVAKRLNIPTSEIVRQNPFAADGMKNGDRLFVYRKQTVNI